jgi:hypothetical protein
MFAQRLLLTCSSTSTEQIGKVMGAKWSRALALLLRKEELGLLEGLVLEVLKERL